MAQKYDTHTLAGVVREVVAGDGGRRFTPFLLDLFFPDTVEFDSENIDFDFIFEDERIAPYVAPIRGGKVMADRAGEIRMFKPAYVKPKHVVKPAQVLRRQAGEQIGGNLSPAQRAQQALANNLMLEYESIRIRWEQMGAEALRTGKVVVAGEDYPEPAEVDFRRDGALTKTLLTTARWGETDVSPVKDVQGWLRELSAPGTDVVFSPEAWELFQDDPLLEKLLDTRRGSATALELFTGNGEAVEFIGMLGASVRLWVYTGYYEDETGTQVKYVPGDELVIGSRGVRGVRAFGAIQSAHAGYVAMSQFPRNWIDDNTGVEFTETQSAPLMVPARPNASMGVKVR